MGFNRSLGATAKKLLAESSLGMLFTRVSPEGSCIGKDFWAELRSFLVIFVVL